VQDGRGWEQPLQGTTLNKNLDLTDVTKDAAKKCYDGAEKCKDKVRFLARGKQKRVLWQSAGGRMQDPPPPGNSNIK